MSSSPPSSAFEHSKGVTDDMTAVDLAMNTATTKLVQEARSARQQLHRLLLSSMVMWILLLTTIVGLSWTVVITSNNHASSTAVPRDMEHAEIVTINIINGNVSENANDAPALYPELTEGQVWTPVASVHRDQVVGAYTNNERIMVDIVNGGFSDVANFDVSMSQNRYPLGGKPLILRRTLPLSAICS